MPSRETQQFVRDLNQFVRNLRYKTQDEVNQELLKFPREQLVRLLAGRKILNKWNGMHFHERTIQAPLTHQETAAIVQIIAQIPRPKTEVPRVDFSLKDEAKKKQDKEIKAAEAQVKKEEAYWTDYFATPQSWGFYHDIDASEHSALRVLFEEPINSIEYTNALWVYWNHTQQDRPKVVGDKVNQIAGIATGTAILGLALFGAKKLFFRA